MATKLNVVPVSAYQLKVRLKHVHPEIWRRIVVPANSTLDRLHEVIQVAMGWRNYHLHQFRYGKATYSEPDPDMGHDAQPEAEVAIGFLLHEPGQSVLYEYDFGDGWEHEVTLEEIHSGVGDRVMPFCTDGQRACPPEDVGGPHGYEEFLRAYLDAQHQDHENMVGWAGETFDPERFEIEVVNAALSGN